MSDFITTTQDAYRSACIATFVTLISAGKGVAERVKDEARGQTAAEYMGVLLIVAAVVAAVSSPLRLRRCSRAWRPSCR